MCMIDSADPVTPINDGEYRKARKAHKCNECRRAIDVGERYHYETFTGDNGFTQHKTCAHCMVARDWLQKECSGWIYGGVEEDLREHVTDNGGYYGMPLARLSVAMKNNWRRRDGSLRPVPPMPSTSYDIRKAALATPAA